MTYNDNPLLEQKIPKLDKIWQYLHENNRVHDIALVGKGIEYKRTDDRRGSRVIESKHKPGYVAGYGPISREQTIFSPPPVCWLASRSEMIANPRQGEATGKPQILINVARTTSSPWRIKAMLDVEGRCFKNNYIVVRPNSGDANPLYLWAILNSPVANAFVASRTIRTHNYEGFIGDVPMPITDAGDMDKVTSAASHYRELALASTTAQGSV